MSSIKLERLDKILEKKFPEELGLAREFYFQYLENLGGQKNGKKRKNI